MANGFASVGLPAFKDELICRIRRRRDQWIICYRCSNPIPGGEDPCRHKRLVTRNCTCSSTS